MVRRRDLILLLLPLGAVFCRRDSATPSGESSGSAPIGGAEVTAVLEVPASDRGSLVTWVYEISGEGHTHQVTIDASVFAALARGERVVVQSGGGGEPEHTHWVLLREA